jgi:hypothetical protein
MNIAKYDPLIIVQTSDELRAGNCGSCYMSLANRPGWLARRSVQVPGVKHSDWICDPCKTAAEARDVQHAADTPDNVYLMTMDEEDELDLLLIPYGCD